MLLWPRVDPDLTWPDGTQRRFRSRNNFLGYLHAVIRIDYAAGNVIDSALPSSLIGKGGAILVFANRSEITAHWDIPSCQYNVSLGSWPRFHISSSCAFS